MLAIHGLNDDKNSSDFLIAPELRATVFEAANSIPISGTTVVKARAFDGTDWSPLHQAHFVVGAPASKENLRLTEIHYRPAAPTEEEIAAGFDRRSYFEFLEITNTTDTDVLLDGAAFSSGIRSRLEGNVSPGESVLVVADRDAFLLRYRDVPAPKIVATFSGGTQLSNSGERIVLARSNDDVLVDVLYDDEAPWPTEADGNGPSLELDANGDWVASKAAGGSPGIAATAATTIAIDSIRVVPRADGTPGAIEIRYSGDAANPIAEFSIDLQSWNRIESSSLGEGELEVPLEANHRDGYLRLRSSD